MNYIDIKLFEILLLRGNHSSLVVAGSFSYESIIFPH